MSLIGLVLLDQAHAVRCRAVSQVVQTDEVESGPESGASSQVRIQVFDQAGEPAGGGLDVWLVRPEVVICGQFEAYHAGVKDGAIASPPRAFTNDEGEVVLPASSVDQIAIAFDEHRVGHAASCVGQDRVTITLRPFPAVRVRVLDGGGEPVADCPIRRVHGPDNDLTSRRSQSYRMKTAADGAQTFFLFDHAVGFPHARFEVVGLFPEAIGVDCEPRTDEVLTVTIELARFGRIRFALIGPDGSELSSEGFSLFIEAKAPGRTENSEDGTELPSFYIGPRHSESLLAFAPLGVTYVVRSSANRLSDWSQYLEVSSPSTSGDTIEVVLEAPDLFQRGRIRLRFTDLEGRPLPGLEFDVRSCAFTSARPSGTFGACLTDDRGLFEADVLFLKQADATPRLLDVWLYETGTSIEVGPGDVGKDGVLDFGECRVDPNPIIARGLVTDEAGVPIPGVELTLRSLERWRRFHHLFDDLVTRSDDRGSFEFRHPQAPHVFGILASLPGHVGSAQFNEEGRTEFSFVMKKTALLELDVKIEGHEGRRCPGLRAVLIHASSGERKVLALDDDGRLTTNVDPGDYRLTLAPWSYAEMEPVDEISFRVEDPSEIIRRTLSVRLEPDTVILNFIDGNPSHSRDREITLRFLSPEPGAPVPEWWYRVEDSMIAAVIPNRPREIEIVKPGYETQRLMLDSAHVDVAFQPISRVMVSGEGLGTRPKDALIEARLVPKEEHDGLRPIEVPIARDGEPNQCKSIAGAQRYRLELRIGKLGKSGMRWRTLRSLIPATSYGSSSYWGDPRSRASFFYLVVPSEVDAASEALSAEIQDE